MGGVVIFDPNDENIGLSIGDDEAVGAHLDIEEGTLYLTDLTNIIEWEGAGTNMTYTWKSGKIRMPRRVNMGAGIVEAESYNSVIFKLYAEVNGTYQLIDSVGVTDDEPFRLPGGYRSNVFGVQIESADRITSFAVAQNIFELAGE
jgi:hypothetical protein